MSNQEDEQKGKKISKPRWYQRLVSSAKLATWQNWYRRSTKQYVSLDGSDPEEEPDKSEPALERQEKLHRIYEENVAHGKPPYANALIRTLGELLWLMNKHDWSSDDTRLGGQERIDLCDVNFTGANLRGANLSWANLRNANFLFADLRNARFDGADLRGAHVESCLLNGASLLWATLSSTYLEKVEMKQASLREAHLDATTVLRDINFDCKTLLADVAWNGVSLMMINWEQISVLGDEYQARQPYKDEQKKEEKAPEEYLKEYQTAVRAYRQLATVLRGQGLNEEADRFAYRASLLQREVLRRQRKWFKYLASWFFWLIAGYGFRPMHSLIAYLLIIFGFMGLYLLNAHFVAPYLTWDQALVLSVSSFHGRGFFEQDITLGSGYARLAAAEAVLGLLIEISFIATFTRRFFGN